jgi:hypothetical protein
MTHTLTPAGEALFDLAETTSAAAATERTRDVTIDKLILGDVVLALNGVDRPFPYIVTRVITHELRKGRATHVRFLHGGMITPCDPATAVARILCRDGAIVDVELPFDEGDRLAAGCAECNAEPGERCRYACTARPDDTPAGS